MTFFMYFLFMSTACAFLASLSFFWYGKKNIGASLLALVACISTGNIWYQARYSPLGYAQVMSDSCTVYIGPNRGYHTLTTIPQGSYIAMNTLSQDWVKIRWQSYEGWVAKNDLRIL